METTERNPIGPPLQERTPDETTSKAIAPQHPQDEQTPHRPRRAHSDPKRAPRPSFVRTKRKELEEIYGGPLSRHYDDHWLSAVLTGLEPTQKEEDILRTLYWDEAERQLEWEKLGIGKTHLAKFQRKGWRQIHYYSKEHGKWCNPSKIIALRCGPTNERVRGTLLRLRKKYPWIIRVYDSGLDRDAAYILVSRGSVFGNYVELAEEIIALLKANEPGLPWVIAPAEEIPRTWRGNLSDSQLPRNVRPFLFNAAARLNAIRSLIGKYMRASELELISFLLNGSWGFTDTRYGRQWTGLSSKSMGTPEAWIRNRTTGILREIREAIEGIAPFMDKSIVPPDVDELEARFESMHVKSDALMNAIADERLRFTKIRGSSFWGPGGGSFPSRQMALREIRTSRRFRRVFRRWPA